MSKINVQSMNMKKINLTANELTDIIKEQANSTNQYQALPRVFLNYIKTNTSDKETILTVGSMLLISAEKLKGNAQKLSEVFGG